MNLEKLSKAVFKLNYTDKTSEDYVYFQILIHLFEYGSFTVTELDKQILYYKENQPKKSLRIERRKLKNIIYGTDKNYEGLIPLNYITAVPPFRNRGGYQEMDYYITEKGIMASLGFSSYKQNINLKKILKFFDYPYSKRYKKFASGFMKLQIEIFLLYHHIQGIVLGSKHEHDADYDRFRYKIVNPFYIRTSNSELKEQLHVLLKKLNIYRQIHAKFVNDNLILKLIWNEPNTGKIPEHGFTGWYNVSSLTSFDKNLKLKKSLKKRKTVKSRGKPILVSEFIYSTFQSYPKVSQSSIEREMKNLGIKSV